jgi:hypothetical protein
MGPTVPKLGNINEVRERQRNAASSTYFGYTQSQRQQFIEQNPQTYAIIQRTYSDEKIRREMTERMGIDPVDYNVVTAMNQRGIAPEIGPSVMKKLGSYFKSGVEQLISSMPTAKDAANTVLDPLSGVMLDALSPTIGAMTSESERGNTIDRFGQGVQMIKDFLTPQTEEQKLQSAEVARIQNERRQQLREAGVETGIQYISPSDPRYRQTREDINRLYNDRY